MPSSLLLLDFGADPAVCNDQGQAPLAGAPYKGDAAMVSLLLKGERMWKARCRADEPP